MPLQKLLNKPKQLKKKFRETLLLVVDILMRKPSRQT